jgi:hypothetical protein
MAFNLFCPLRQMLEESPETATRVIKAALPGYPIHEVTEVELEFIPGNYKDLTGDKSAMDAIIRFVDTNGKSGFIAVETKYSENLGTNAAYDKDEKGNKIFAFEKDDNGNYIIGRRDYAYITEEANGDKAMYIVRDINKAAGYDATFTNTAKNCMTAELDFGFEKTTYDGVQNYFFVNVKDGVTKDGNNDLTGTYRFNLNVTPAGTGYVYAEKSTGGAQPDNKFQIGADISYFDLRQDEVATFSATLNTTGEAPAFDLYINGEYAGSLPCSLFGGHKANLDFSKAYVSSVKIGVVSAAQDNAFIDNVCFK